MTTTGAQTDSRVDPEFLARVQKILSKTRAAGCTPHEAEAAYAMVSRPRTARNLSMDDVKSGLKGPDEWVDEEVGRVTKWSMSNNFAYNIIRDFFFVECHFSRHGAERAFFIFGRPENVATARHVFTSLMRAFHDQFEDYKRRTGCAQSDRRAFEVGLAKGFRDKLEEDRRVDEMERDLLNGNSAKSTALALVSIKEKTLQSFADIVYKGKKPASKSFRTSAVGGTQSAVDAGYKAGRSLNLDRAIGGRKRKAIG